MATTTRAVALLAYAVVAASIGCAPSSQQPLSDEQNSIVDERLLGKWREASRDFENPPLAFEVRKRADSTSAFEIVFISPGNDKEVEQTAPFFAAKLGEHEYLSVDFSAFEEPQDRGKAGFVILQYRFVDENRVELFCMDEKVIAHAINNRELKGSYLGWTARNASHVVIADSTENLRRYLEKHGDDCFERGRGDVYLTFRRSKE